MNTPQQHIQLTREDGIRLTALGRLIVAAHRQVEDRPDDRALPDGYRWVKGSGGTWAPVEDVGAC
jgi:hypothetical protein